MCRYVATAALLAALVAPVNAAPPPHRGKLPAVFVGRWCVIRASEPSDTVTTHHRAPCGRDEGKVTIRSDGFETGDVRCKALVVAAEPKYGNHHHLTKFWCEASDGRSQTVNYWISIDQKGVLTIQETEREP
jgi:hypothetical protein